MDTDHLYHVSDRPGLDRFEPRPPPSRDAGVGDPVVWAISGALLHNYLLPRECPRVTFYAGSQTTLADRERFLGPETARHIVAIEHAWLARIHHARLWIYAFVPDTFSLIDAGAGYFVSRLPVDPVWVREIDDLPSAIATLGVELRVLPSLWPLRDAVHASTLAYSFIRMRNAIPRPEALPRTEGGNRGCRTSTPRVFV